MKLNKFYLAIMAIALPLGFISCGSDDDGDDPTPVTPTFVNQDRAARYTFSQSSAVQSVTFGESNSVVIEKKNEETGETEYVVGTYTVNGDTYTVSSGSGSWTFTVGTDGSKVTVTIKDPSGTTEEALAQKTTASDKSEKTLSICGDWKPNYTVLKLKKKNAQGWIAPDPLKGIDFQAVKNRAEQEGCVIDEDFKDEYVVKTVSFYATKEFCVNFTSGKGYVADWQWTGSDDGMKFTWKDEDANSNEFLEGGKATCVVKADGPYKGECHLTLISDIKMDNGEEWDVNITFRLIR